MEYITLNNGIKCPAVGRGIKESGIAREDIFLSTKLWPSEYENENAVDETLERLGVDYVDLFYIHQPAGNWMSGYRLLEKAYREGKAKSIGISNFEGEYIEKLQNEWEIVPQFIQVEAHPYFTQKDPYSAGTHRWVLLSYPEAVTSITLGTIRTDAQLAQFATWRPQFEKA